MERPWPYPSVTDRTWLATAGRADPYLESCRKAVRSLLPPSRPGPATPEYLASALTAARELADRVDWALLSLVGEARASGMTWEQLGQALGVSKQAAHQRFAPYVALALEQAAAQGSGDDGTG